jgi:hypothetical protein
VADAVKADICFILLFIYKNNKLYVTVKQ